MTLDDNNGNIGDGTPNYPDIDGGFRDQGFPGFDLDFIAFSNEVSIADTTNGAGPFVAQIDMVAAINPPIVSGTVLFRVNGSGGFSSVPMSQGAGNTWSGNIPGIASPAIVEYYFRGEDNSGGTGEFPLGGASNALSFRIGISNTVLSFDFEAGTNEGWTSGDTGDNATTGLWARGNPNGTAAQPEDDHTVPGDLCWFTGQGTVGGAIGGNDVDGGTTSLLSPIIDASSFGVMEVNYWAWYSNDAGNSPNADIFTVQVSNNGGTSWLAAVTLGPTENNSGGWSNYSINVNKLPHPDQSDAGSLSSCRPRNWLYY